MENRTIYITEFDRKRLRDVIGEARRKTPLGNPYLDSLEAELGRATIVPPTEVPPDVVTMNSRVCLLDLDDQEEMIYSLVFPQDADIGQGKISVLAPIGTAILGYRVGDVLTWKVPDGERRLRVKELLYQPEAAGDYDL